MAIDERTNGVGSRRSVPHNYVFTYHQLIRLGVVEFLKIEYFLYLEIREFKKLS